MRGNRGQLRRNGQWIFMEEALIRNCFIFSSEEIYKVLTSGKFCSHLLFATCGSLLSPSPSSDPCSTLNLHHPLPRFGMAPNSWHPVGRSHATLDTHTHMYALSLACF